MEQGVLPGAAWWVESAGSVVSRGAVGKASLEPVREPATIDTAYDLASLTKPLSTAFLAVLLEQEGILDLETPVSRYLPELQGTPWADASLLHLGVHASGLPAWLPLYLDGSGRPAYLEAIAGCRPAVEPGRTLYSDLGYILLGFVVEDAAGEGLDTLFRKRIAEPLGIDGVAYAGVTDRFAAAAPTERGNLYEKKMAGALGDRHAWRTEIIRGEVHDANAHGLGGVAGHAGLFGTAEGVAAICREILRQDADRLLRPSAGSGDRTFGLVTAAGSAAARGVLPDGSVGHTGFTGTSIWLDPKEESIRILLTNRVHPEVDETLDFQAVRSRFHALSPGAGSAAHW